MNRSKLLSRNLSKRGKTCEYYCSKNSPRVILLSKDYCRRSNEVMYLDKMPKNPMYGHPPTTTIVQFTNDMHSIGIWELQGHGFV